MALDNWKEWPETCDYATIEQLESALGLTHGYSIKNRYLLRKFTVKIPLEYIPWSSLRSLIILGNVSTAYNEKLRNAHIHRGAYINSDCSCVILIHPEDSAIPEYLNRCSSQLQFLLMRFTTLENLDVRSIPALKTLHIPTNPLLSAIHGLSELSDLVSLDCSYCDFLQELPGIAGLSNLIMLLLTGCINLRELPNLENLTQLTRLDLSSDHNLQKLSGLGNLTQLTNLYLPGCTSLRELPGLGNLSRLTFLDLSNCVNLEHLPTMENLTLMTDLLLRGCTLLRELPEGLRKMTTLRRLTISDLRLQDLPDWLPEIAESFSFDDIWEHGQKKAIVFLKNTTVENIPDMSIFEQPYEVVAEWFKNRALGRTQPLNEIKVVFLGDGEAGKSLTIARLMSGGGEPVDYMDETTPGIVIKDKEYDLDGRKIQVHYWDFGGQEIMHSMHRIFLTKRTMYVVLLNAREDKQGEQAQYWLQNIQSFAPDAPVLLVLNKIDRNPKAELAERTLRSTYPGLTQIVRLSATEFDKDRFNKEFTDVLLDEIVKTGYLEAQWPSAWIKVKEQLEKMKSHYILGNEYKALCTKCQVDDVQTELLHWFNDLGVSFCFCGKEDYVLKKHVILRPDWITNGLYIILFNECAGAQNGQIPHESIYALLERAGEDKSIRCTLPEARYDRPGDIEYVLGVMRKFQLSLDTKDGKEFIPMLCQHDSTMDIHYYKNDTDILEFNMVFKYLPENLLHRLMVERYTELDLDNVWRNGARFQLKELGYSAVVFIDTDNTLRFFIRHTDPMHRPNTYLTVLKDNVDRIVEKMALEAPTCKLIYKLNGKRDEFDYEEVKLNRQLGDTTMTSKAHRKKILIEDILNQSAPDNTEKEMRLLADIRRSCQHIQGEPSYYLTDDGQGLEDNRNRRIRDDLHGWHYRIQDQTQRGLSGGGKGIGELDLLLFSENTEPWTAIEALRVSNGTKAPWNRHLDKLLDNYNYFGAPFLYLLTYVDADPKRFAKIWQDYQKHIPDYVSGHYRCIENSFSSLEKESTHAFKAAKCLYSCGGDPITVYHIFARIPLHGE